jgi:hypothetical protein
MRPDHEPVTERSRTVQDAQMADVEYVECAEGDHGFARLAPRLVHKPRSTT